MLWLGVFEYIEAAHPDALGSHQMVQVHVGVPENPGPEFISVADGKVGELFSVD